MSKLSTKDLGFFRKMVVEPQFFITPRHEGVRPLNIHKGQVRGVYPETRLVDDPKRPGEKKRIVYQHRVNAIKAEPYFQDDGPVPTITYDLSIAPIVQKLLESAAFDGKVANTNPYSINCYVVGFMAGGPQLQDDGTGQITNVVKPGWAQLVCGLDGRPLHGWKFKANKWQGPRFLARQQELLTVHAKIYRTHYADVMVIKHAIVGQEPTWQYQKQLIFQLQGIDVAKPLAKPIIEALKPEGLTNLLPVIRAAIELSYHYPRALFDPRKGCLNLDEQAESIATEELKQKDPLWRATEAVWWLPPRKEEATMEVSEVAEAKVLEAGQPVAEAANQPATSAGRSHKRDKKNRSSTKEGTGDQ